MEYDLPCIFNIVPVRVQQDKAVDEALKALGMLESMLQWLLQSAQAGNASNGVYSHSADSLEGDAPSSTPEAAPTPEVRSEQMWLLPQCAQLPNQLWYAHDMLCASRWVTGPGKPWCMQQPRHQTVMLASAVAAADDTYLNDAIS